MDKLNDVFLHSCVQHICANQPFDKACADFHVNDKRVARLLVVLKQLHESAEGLEALPEPKLSEIVSSAIRLCGFVDPVEARYVMAIFLDAIENGISNPGGGSLRKTRDRAVRRVVGPQQTQPAGLPARRGSLGNKLDAWLWERHGPDGNRQQTNGTNT